jgi:WD40 repeat protein/serine/threonine protein kinase
MADDSSERFVLLNRLAEEFAARYRRGERPALAEYIARHPELADDIRDLFPALAEVEQVREERQEVSEPAATGPLPPLERLGDFRILREIGHGGMGVVYEAEQLSLGRHVALKVLSKRRLVDAQAKKRFEREAKVAAKLHHTNIVPVFGVGAHDGLPYYVMQFIPGLGLDEVLEELQRLQPGKPGTGSTPRLTGGELRISRKDVSAVAVARSLLTGQFTPAADEAVGQDSDPAPPRPPPNRAPQGAQRDATAVPAPGTDSSSAKASADGSPKETPAAGRLSDIFSLSSSSVVLPGPGRPSGKKQLTYWQSVAKIGVQVADALEYAHRQGIQHRDIKPSNLLLDTTGTVWVTDFGVAKAEDQQDLTHTGDVLGTLRYMPPEAFDGRRDARSDVYSLGLTLFELLAFCPAFGEKERNRLIKQVATEQPARLHRLNPEVPRDLVTIVHKAIERDPAHRYQSAAELADDFQRFLDDEPIRARQVALRERAWRWCRRNPVVASLSALVLLLLLAVAVGSTVAAFHVSAARDNEERERRRAEANAEASHQGLVQLQVTKGLQLMDDGDLFRALAWFMRALQLDAGRPEEEMHRIRLTAVLRQCPRLCQLWCHARPTYSVEFSPDGRRAVTASEDGTAQVWDLASGAAVTPPLRHQKRVWYATFSPDGLRVVTASDDGSARVWNAATGEAVTGPLQHAGAVWLGSFNHDNRLVVTASADRTARVWDAATGKPVTPPLSHDRDVSQAAFSRDGRFVVTVSDDKTAKIWDADSGRLHVPPLDHRDGVEWAEFSPDGRQLLTIAGDSAYLWDAQTGRALFPPRKLHGGARRGAFSPDGRRAVVAGGDTAQVLDVATGQLESVQVQHPPGIWFVTFSPDGRRIVTVGGNASRLWDATTGEPLTPRLKHNGLAYHAAFSPDGRFLATAGGDTANVWDTITVRPAVTALKPGPAGQVVQPDQLKHPVLSADGRYVAAHSASAGRLGVWDTVSGEAIPTPSKYERTFGSCGFGNDGRWLITALADQSACVWELATGELLFTLPRQERPVRCIALSPDNRLAVTACDDKTARVWDVVAGQPRGSIMQHSEGVALVTFSPDGRQVLTGSVDWTAQVWDWASGLRIGRTLKHGGPLRHASFSPDGRRVVTGSHDRTARVWDAATGEPLTPPLPHRGQVLSAAFSPDGRYVATATEDMTARVWEAATGLPLTLPLKHQAEVSGVVFSPDGRLVISVSADRKVWRWDLGLAPDRRPIEDLLLLAQLLDGHQLDACGGFVPVETETLKDLWQRLRMRYPGDFIPRAE